MASWSASDPDLEALRWSKRIVLLFGSGPALEEQRRILAANQAGLSERDLAVYEIPDSSSLRQRFKITGSTLTFILLGKDGGEKLRTSQPITLDKLFATVDAMPMRRSEKQR